MGQYWGEHGALETPLLPRSLHTPFLKRVPLVLQGSLRPTRKMAKLGTWPRQRHWGAMPSNRTKDPVCHPCLMGVWKKSGEGTHKSTFSRGCPTHTGLTESLGRASERQTLKGQSSDTSPRAGPGTGWVWCPPQNSHHRLSRPKTSLQTPLPTGAALAQLQAQRAYDACCCPAWRSAPKAWHRRKPATWSLARTSLGLLTDSWCSSPSFRGLLRTHTSHGLR